MEGRGGGRRTCVPHQRGIHVDGCMSHAIVSLHLSLSREVLVSEPVIPLAPAILASVGRMIAVFAALWCGWCVCCRGAGGEVRFGVGDGGGEGCQEGD